MRQEERHFLRNNAEEDLTSGFYSTVNLFDMEGNLRGYYDVAIDAVHELLHTARVDHPFETTQATDTELIRNGQGYISTPNTDPNILYNIMNYPNTIINGQSYRESGSSELQNMITYGQIQFLLNEINLQKQGLGVSLSDPYWNVFPGTPIK